MTPAAQKNNTVAAAAQNTRGPTTISHKVHKSALKNFAGNLGELTVYLALLSFTSLLQQGDQYNFDSLKSRSGAESVISQYNHQLIAFY